MAQLPAMLVHDPKVHEEMRRQHVQLQVTAFDINRSGVAHQFEHRIRQRACTKHFTLIELLRKPCRRIRQRHQARAWPLMQGFDECLNFVFQHARHQPLAAFLVDLVQCKQRHINRHAIFDVARLMKICGRAVHTTESQNFREGLRGDACCLVAHQLFLRQQQQFGLLFNFFAVPSLATCAAAHVRWQLLVIKSVNQLLVHQHVLPARLVLKVLHLGDQPFIGF